MHIPDIKVIWEIGEIGYRDEKYFMMKDHLISCLDFCYISKDMFNKGIELIDLEKVTLNGYIKYIEGKVKQK